MILKVQLLQDILKGATMFLNNFWNELKFITNTPTGRCIFYVLFRNFQKSFVFVTFSAILSRFNRLSLNELGQKYYSQRNFN